MVYNVNKITIRGMVAFFFFSDKYGFAPEGPNYLIIKKCFQAYARKKFKEQSYIDISELVSTTITKENIKKSISADGELIKKLYVQNYPVKKEDLIVLQMLFSDFDFDMQTTSDLFAILFWALRIFRNKRAGSSKAPSNDDILKELVPFILLSLNSEQYKIENTILYDEKSCCVHIIEHISDFLSLMNKLKNVQSKATAFYYRGQSKTTFALNPSILRSSNLKKNENKIYRELLINCPDDFKSMKYHIDYLVKMQHYGLPTRLLDITRNPLVALYFACRANKEMMGEIVVFAPDDKQIKYETSDTVAMISSLPLFSIDEQLQLEHALRLPENKRLSKEKCIIDRFIHELQTENPGFINKIKYNDLSDCLVVLTKKNNNRIIKQDGAFIICGLNDNPAITINQNLRLKVDNKTCLIFVNNKSDILDELSLLSINESSLFPEIDHVSAYIKEKYSR